MDGDCRLYPVAVTVAGVDPSGGAGVAADLKAFAALGVHGAVVVAALTVQDTRGVYRVEPVDSELVGEQLSRVLEDYGECVRSVKIGVLGSADNVRAVARILRAWRGRLWVVVDPVWRASAGQELQSKSVLRAVAEELLPGSVATPNTLEAGELLGMKVSTVEEAREAARRLVEDLGARAAIVKGGHLDKPVDVVYYEGTMWEVRGSRVEGCSHGTGCTYSSALAAGLARGMGLLEAARLARRLVEEAIRFGFRVGQGSCPVDPLAYLARRAARQKALEELLEALEEVRRHSTELVELIPEVGMNIAVIGDPRLAAAKEDVVAVDGRIVRCCGRATPVGPARPGASDHMARLLLTLTKFYPEIRTVLNARYTPEAVEAAERAGLRVLRVDRRMEPQELKAREGGTMEWIGEQVHKLSPTTPPDIVYDTGDVGKEPMIRVLARNPLEAVEKLLKILSSMRADSQHVRYRRGLQR